MKPYTALLLLLLLLPFGLTAQENIFPFNASWKYLDDGSDQGTAWRNTAFNDTGWKSGPGKFGYGISDANTAISAGLHSKKTHTTTYFRKSISIANPGIFSTFTAHIKRDDGLVVYVNGTEVLRDNMPSGEISYTTKASSASDNGTAIQTFTIPKTAFAAGANLIAVEVHQQNGNNPDMAFDMALTASIAPIDNTPPAVVNLNRHSPLSEVTSATSLTYRLSFSEGVSGVDRTDFVVTNLSGTVSGTLATNAVSAQGSDGSQYNITISAISGEGSLRLDLRSGNRGIADLAGNPLGEEGYTSGQVYTIEQQQQPPPPPPPSAYGFATVTNLAGVSIATNTGEKPQSKPWTYAGKWWMVMPNASGTYLWRLDGTSWTQQLRLSTKTNSKADCKVAGNLTHVFMFQGASSQIASLEYVPETGTYQMWSRRTSTTGITLDTGVEIATIDIDGTGRMWLASDGSTSINVRWSDAPYNNWSAPIVLANNTSTDDICSIIALPGKIGVFWSNQATKRFGFKTHLDGASPTTWSADEVPASQSALNVGNGMADDHVNLAAASDGTLYCAVKTEFNSSSHPTIALLVRRPDGSWDNLYGITNGAGTRPIVILNEALGKVKVIYTASDSGGDILYRESPMSGIAFGSLLTLMSGSYNNATSAKANYSSEIVVLASSSTQAVGVLASDGAAQDSPPAAPLLLSPLNSATGQSVSPTLSWQASSSAITYQAQLSTASNFSTLVYNQSGLSTTTAMVSGLAASTVYYWRVRASNATGSSNWSTVWSFTTAPGATTVPAVPVLALPVNGATDISVSPALSWNAAAGAETYQAQVSSVSNFSSTVFNQSTIGATTVQAGGLVNNTLYYWRVRASNSAGTSSWSAVWSFTTSPASDAIIKPLFVTEKVAFDSDDPAIWINKANPAESMVLGTDKAVGEIGGLYAFTLEGNIIRDRVIPDMDVPMNVDIAYGMSLGGNKVDIAVTTERGHSRLRVHRLPDMAAVDGGGIPVFVGETGDRYNEPMGVGLYTRPADGKLFAIVSRKAGPTDGTYLWQYLLEDDGTGKVKGTLVRKFGKFGGSKEIEAVAVDNELGYVYYAEEKAGIRKYYADPDRGNQELAFFGTTGFTHEHEGIAIYKVEDGTGYILVVDQKANSLHVFPREGTAANPHNHQRIKIVTLEATVIDGIEVVNYVLPPHFQKGLLVAMSSNKTFHYYRWEDIAGSDLMVKPPKDSADPETVPAVPVLASPANGAVGQSLAPTLAWNTAAGATGYQAQVSTSSGFTSTVFNQSGISATSVAVSGLAFNTVYYWRVRASNTAGISNWSEVRSFSTETESSPPPPSTATLVGHWKMDEGSGSSLLDASGLGNHAATVKSPGWVAGVLGLALQLNGTSQYARVPDHASLNITDAISLAGWIRPEKNATQYIIKKAMNSQADGYELSLASSGEVFFRLNQTSAANTYRINSTIPYPINGSSWMHIAATFDGSTMRLYINGVENTARVINSSLAIGVNTLPLMLGADADGKSRFQGAIDDMRIYHGALSAAEVSALMSGAATAKQTHATAAMHVAAEPLAMQQPQVLEAYPNPFRSEATIQFSLAEAGEYVLELWDMKGKQLAVLHQGCAAAGEQHSLRLDALGLARGLYLLRLQSPLGLKTLRLMHE